MKQVYVAVCTEYDFGQRDAGVAVSDDLKTLKAHIKKTNSGGSEECFFRYSEPKKAYVDEKVWKKFMKANPDGLVMMSKLTGDFYEKMAE